MKSILYLPIILVVSCSKNEVSLIGDSSAKKEKVAPISYESIDTLILDKSLSVKERVDHILDEKNYYIFTSIQNSEKDSLNIAIRDKSKDDFTVNSFVITLNKNGTLKHCADRGTPMSGTG